MKTEAGKHIFDGRPCRIIDVETKKAIGEYGSIKDAELSMFGKYNTVIWNCLNRSKKRRFKCNGKLYAARYL